MPGLETYLRIQRIVGDDLAIKIWTELQGETHCFCTIDRLFVKERNDEIIKDHIENELSVDDLATKYGLSRSWLRALLRRRSGARYKKRKKKKRRKMIAE